MNSSARDEAAGHGAETSAAVEKLLFDAASMFGSAAEQSLFLKHVCRGDPELRARLDVLLGVQEDADDFFEFDPRHAVADEEDEPMPDGGLGIGLGRYRLIERLGSGGCGVVYLAEQLEPVRRKVAIKIIRLGLDSPEVIARFRAETQALASMNHPHIARVLDAVTTSNGRPFFVMELVDGESISDYCDSRRLSVRERLELFEKVCRAIQHAHQRGVVHRDIKPSNILVTSHDGMPIPKVIDFGIAMESEDADEGGQQRKIGTPDYMSPEQATGDEPVDTRSDIYSLGIVLGELLGGPPRPVPAELAGGETQNVREFLQRNPPRPPSEALRRLPACERTKIAGLRGISAQKLILWCEQELDWIVRKAVDRDPAQRYATVNGLAADVRRWLDEEPVLARPQTRRYRLVKLVRRNRLVFGAGTLALVGLLGGLSAATVLFLREKAARAEAERAHASEMVLRERADVRSRVAEAAVRIHYKDMEGADRLLATIPVEDTPASLEAVDVFAKVAEWHLFAGRMAEVDRRLVAMAVALARVDSTDNEKVSMRLLPAATAVCQSGDMRRYDWFRKIAIERFGNTNQPVVAEQMLKGCLLRPAGPEILDRLAPLAERVETALEDKDSRTWTDHDLRAWSCFALALFHYRQGDDELARIWAERCLAQPQVNPTCPISSRILLAMVERRSGSGGEAEAYLEGAEEEAAGHCGIEKLGGTNAGFWFDWVNVRLLLEEAGQQVEEGGE